MTDQTNTIAQTALQTAEAMAPALLASGVAGPQAAAIATLAPIALQFLQSATQLQQVGVLPPDKLAGLFATIGQGIQSTHAQWVAMNAADAAKAAS